MSTSVRFHVLTVERLQPGEQPVLLQLSHYGGSSEVVNQCFGEERAIKSLPLPENCWLYDADPDAEMTEKRVSGTGERLRYTRVKQVAKLEMPDWVRSFDLAMMAYFRLLAKLQPETIVVLELW